MRKWVNTGIVSLFWVLSLVSGTGLDSIYHVTDRARIILLVLTIAVALLENRHLGGLTVSRRDLFTFGGMIVVFTASSVLHGEGTQSFDYLYSYLVVYLISKLKLNESDFKRIGLCIGVAGLAVLFIYDEMTILSGWNENSIAMIGFFSYLIFIISHFNAESRKNKIQIVITALIVSYFLGLTNSRSCILFIAVAIVFALKLVDRSFFLRKDASRILLFVPLLITIPVASISSTSLVNRLDLWSMSHYKKPFFNGRDVTWAYGFRLLLENLLLGNGKLTENYWHNSALFVLTTYGVLGYSFWIGTFDVLLGKARDYLKDYSVQGCFVCFLIIYVQQSVELGLVSTTPDLIPYIMLGMMLGRIRFLKSESHVEV